MSVNLFVPLANDSYAAAAALDGTTGTVTGGNNGATKEAGEPAVAGNPGGASVWWKFKAPATGRLTLSTAGSGLNTLLGVYRGAVRDRRARRSPPTTTSLPPTGPVRWWRR